MWLFSMEPGEIEAIEADLMAVGWTFDDVPRRLSYPALFAFLAHLPTTSAYVRMKNPDTASWMDGSLVANLLAELGHRLDILAWQQTADGQKNRKRPQPWPRPWVKDKNKDRIGAGPIPASEWETFWDGGK